MRPDHRGRNALSMLASCLLAAAVGCGGLGPSTQPPKEDQARLLIEEALNAWKQGHAPQVLERRTPPLRFVDPDLAAGLTLADFRIDPEGQVYDYVMDFSVKLTLRDRRGRTLSRDAVYQVAVEPGLAVLRNDP